MNSKKNDNFSLRNRFKYWLDNKMTNDSLGLIRSLIIASLILAIIIAGLIILFHFNEEGEVASVFWDSIATIINAWMPSFEDGSIGYVILMSIVAIAGLLFTSVFIGIITSAIEEKIANLKKGNSIVVEKDHIVVLGFYPGEYTLLDQLIKASTNRKACIVIAEDMDREDMENYISENLKIPKNIKIVCRTVDITDPIALEKCSIETSKTIIISPTEDMKTIKSILAVSALLEEKKVSDISVNAIISRNEYNLPISIRESHNITTLETNNILAKMIAHSCTQTGLSKTFKEVFDFDGSEFYMIDLEKIENNKFSDLMMKISHGTPIGIYRNSKVMMNPPLDTTLKDKDKIIVFSEEIDSVKIEENLKNHSINQKISLVENEENIETIIIGHNETLPTILQELPENVTSVLLFSEEVERIEKSELEKISAKRRLKLKFYKEDPHSVDTLLKVSEMAKHIIILNNHDKEKEEADMEVISLLLNLRDIRKRNHLKFNITVEMQQEHNQKLVGRGDHTDFLVVSSMSSLILAQLAENPKIKDIFKEILSNEGNELYLKNAKMMNLHGTYSTSNLRMILLEQGYIYLGYVDKEKNSHYNVPLNEKVTLTDEDDLIVLGEK